MISVWKNNKSRIFRTKAKLTNLWFSIANIQRRLADLKRIIQKDVSEVGGNAFGSR
jgi:hypothetical protein